MTRWILGLVFVNSIAPALFPADSMTVRIQAPNDQAAHALLRALNEQGRHSGLIFTEAAGKAQIELMVDWTSNWGTMAPPQATVTVSGKGLPSFSVQRTAPLRKIWAVEACAKEIVKRVGAARSNQGVEQ